MLKGFSVLQVLGSLGAANSILYLDANKNTTGGAALTFDGTNFATTGTASATKLIPTGGTAIGNGMYLPSANTVAFSTNGTECARFNSTGNFAVGGTPISTAGITIANDGNGSATVKLSFSTSGNERAFLSMLAGAGEMQLSSGYAGYGGRTVFLTAGVERARFDSVGNFVAGGQVALATNATDGFVYVPTCAGVPTGVPSAYTDMAPIVVDTTNNRWYFYSGGAWRNAGP